jgi:hypothetical protein
MSTAQVMLRKAAPSWAAALAAIAVTVLVLALAAQVSTLRTDVGPPVRPATSFYIPAGAAAVTVTHIPTGCRPKTGCSTRHAAHDIAA